jgi:hypothetical protein
VLTQLYVGESLTLALRLSDGFDGQPLDQAVVVADLWAPGLDRTKVPPTRSGIELIYHQRTRDYLAVVHTDPSWPTGRWTYRVTSRRMVDGEMNTNISFAFFNLQP